RELVRIRPSAGAGEGRAGRIEAAGRLHQAANAGVCRAGPGAGRERQEGRRGRAQARWLIVQRNISYCAAPKLVLYMVWRGGCRFFLGRPGRVHQARMGLRAQIRAMPDDRPNKDHSMTEAIETTASRSRSKAAAPAAFEMPKFELPNFEIPKMEIP